MFSKASVVAGALACFLASTASAGPRSKRPKGVVALTKASLSGKGPALLKKVRKASTGRAVFFDKDGWRIYYALAAPHSLSSSELTIRISDVSFPRQPKQPVLTRHKLIYSQSPVMKGQFLLTRDDVPSPNARLLIEIESDGVLVAQRTFFIQGKVDNGPRSVDFSEEEANASDDEPEVANRR